MNLFGRSFLKEIDFTKDEFVSLIDMAEQLRQREALSPRTSRTHRTQYRPDLRKDVNPYTVRFRSCSS